MCTSSYTCKIYFPRMTPRPRGFSRTCMRISAFNAFDTEANTFSFVHERSGAEQSNQEPSGALQFAGRVSHLSYASLDAARAFTPALARNVRSAGGYGPRGTLLASRAPVRCASTPAVLPTSARRAARRLPAGAVRQKLKLLRCRSLSNVELLCKR